LILKKHILEVDAKRYDIQSILSDVYLKCETDNTLGNGPKKFLKIIFGIENADFKFVN
jgi:hypothetical protein